MLLFLMLAYIVLNRLNAMHIKHRQRGHKHTKCPQASIQLSPRLFCHLFMLFKKIAVSSAFDGSFAQTVCVLRAFYGFHGSGTGENCMMSPLRMAVGTCELIRGATCSSTGSKRSHLPTSSIIRLCEAKGLSFLSF